QVRDDIEREAHQALNTASDQVAARISDRVQGLGLVLRAGAAVLASGSEPDPEVWRNYVSELDLMRTLPGIARLGYVAAVDAQAPVVFMEPMDETVQSRLGFDMYSEAVRRI